MVVVLAVLSLALGGAAGAFGQDYGMLSGPEQGAMFDTFQYAMENNAVNHAAEWVNPDAATSGAVVPIRTFADSQGQPCREFITSIVIGGREEQGYGTACRQPDGSWQIVAGEQSVVAPPPTVVFSPPPRYYFYPYGFYDPYRIYLSFSFVYRSGHLYRGSYYLDGRSFRHRHPLHIRERVYVGPRLWDHHRWHRAPEYRERSEQRGRLEPRGRIEPRQRTEQRERIEQRDRSRYGKRSEYRDNRWRNPDRGQGERGRR
jgi:surface antigen